MSDDRIIIRGTSDGVSIEIGAGYWPNLLQELEDMLSRRASFFKGGRVFLSVGNRLLTKEEIEALGAILARHQMTLWALESSAAETQEIVQRVGLEVHAKSVVGDSVPSEIKPVESNTTETIRRTIRSGQTVEHFGNIIIIGDVNPGARITAGGYIIVWGKLRGTAHAGALNPENAFVCALMLAPTQLIIGNFIARTPSEYDTDQILPEMAFVQDEQIIAEAWQ